jgi:hypothetical protein
MTGYYSMVQPQLNTYNRLLEESYLLREILSGPK